MQCKDCGGPVEWKGPLTNLTHTECENCGAVDNQMEDDNQDEEMICYYCGQDSCDCDML